jgi:hypothetical protein
MLGEGIGDHVTKQLTMMTRVDQNGHVTDSEDDEEEEEEEEGEGRWVFSKDS